jgi:anion-transporting  ArsA/GET3 family ATPase
MSHNDVLSNLKTYYWSFSIDYNPTSLIAVAITEEEARQSILDTLTQITEANAKYVQLATRHSQLVQQVWNSTMKLSDELDQRISAISEEMKSVIDSINTNRLTGPYTRSMITYNLDCKTTYGKTLKEIIEEPASKVTPFYRTSIFSALDG